MSAAFAAHIISIRTYGLNFFGTDVVIRIPNVVNARIRNFDSCVWYRRFLVACDIRYVIKKRKIATREPDNNIQREENLRGTVCERERKVMSLTNSF
jgi:hypothetical protein